MIEIMKKQSLWFTIASADIQKYTLYNFMLH